MTYIVSGGALNSTHSLTPAVTIQTTTKKRRTIYYGNNFGQYIKFAARWFFAHGFIKSIIR